jgi:cyclopropane-fatty-acyl-phospholipid synthase
MAPKKTSQTLPRTGLVPLLIQLDEPGEIQLPDGAIVPLGDGEPRFRVIFRSQQSLRTPMTELGVSRAFVAGEVDVEGDVHRTTR